MRPNPQETAGLITFTEEILNGKLHFLCNVTIAHRICNRSIDEKESLIFFHLGFCLVSTLQLL